MASNKTGRIEYIEPNVTTLGINNRNGISQSYNIDDAGNAIGDLISHDNDMPYNVEDLNIAVDFYVLPNDRDNCGEPSNDGNNTPLKYSGRGSASYMGGTPDTLFDQGGNGENGLTQKSFMTTNFTDISLVNPEGNTSEAVGITNISIKYNNYFTPEVNITFEDVFGASIFLKEEQGMYNALNQKRGQNGGNPPYASVAGSNLLASLFAFPYPTFVLVVKGFFGNAVAYHLTCSGTKIDFNTETGNFIIKASFLGSLYGSLADVPLTFISLAPYLPYYGRDYWDEQTENETNGRFFNLDFAGNKTPMKTFAEITEDVDGIERNLKKTFETHQEVEDYKNLLTARKLLNDLQFPMATVNPGKDMLPNIWYCRRENNIYYYYYLDIQEDGKSNAVTNTMTTTIYGKLESFFEKVEELNDSNTGYKLPRPDAMLALVPNNEFHVIEKSGLRILGKKFFIEKDNNETKPLDNPSAVSYNRFTNLLYSKPDENNKDTSITAYSGETIDTLKTKYPVLAYFLEEDASVGYLHLSNRATRLSIYEIQSAVDYRQEIIRQKNLVTNEIKTKKDKIEGFKKDALIELYGYAPSIKNVYGMVLAHLDAFMTAFYGCLKNIDAKKPTQERSLDALGIGVNMTDLPSNYSTKAHIPPFTLFYGPVNKDGKITNDIKWPGDVSQRLNNLEEVKFVEALIEATSLYQKETGDFVRKDTDNFNGNRCPANLFDCLENIKNPYSDILSKADSDTFVYYVCAIFALRLYYYIASGYKDKLTKEDIHNFAHIEAKNFTAVYDKTMAEQVLNYLLQQVNTHGAKFFVESLCGHFSQINNDKRKIWDISQTNTNHGIFTKNANGEFIYTWHKEKTHFIDINEPYAVSNVPDNEVFTMPIGVYNFSTLKKEFSRKETYNDIRYITLTNSAFSGRDVKVDSFNNRESFRLVSKPCQALNLFSGKTISISTTDSAKTEDLENIFLDRMSQYKTSTSALYPKSIFITPKTCTISGISVADMSKKGSVTAITSFYDTEKNSINEKYAVCHNGISASVNVFTHAVYYNQNEDTRSSDKFEMKVNAKTKNCAKAYLFLYSILTNNNSVLENLGEYYNKNGFYPYIELLKEGAFYWRMKFMMEHEHIDPINLQGLGYVNAGMHQVYSLDKTYTTKDSFKGKGESTGLYLKPKAGAKSDYTNFCKNVDSYSKFGDVILEVFNCSISRVENLINLFYSWANGKSLFAGSNVTFGMLTYCQEFTLRKRKLNLQDFLGLNGKKITELDTTQREIYKLTDGDGIKIINNQYISNAAFLTPTDKVTDNDNTQKEAKTIVDYRKTQNSIIATLYDVYFAFDSSIFGNVSSSNYKEENFIEGFKEFIAKVTAFGYDKEDKPAISYENKFTSSDVKLSTYLKLKNIYDRWCCSKNETYWKYGLKQETNSNTRSCISAYFDYIDAYYNKIGDSLIVNMTNVANQLKQYTPNAMLTKDQIDNLYGNSTILSFMAKVAENSGCMFLAMPQRYGSSSFKDLSEIFKPISYNNVDYTEDTSSFVVMYRAALSEHLANNDGYDDDGFDIADSLGNISPVLPAPYTESYDAYTKDNSKIPAFGVTFGKGNQSYFFNLNFDTSNAQNSEYAIRAQINIANKANSGNRDVTSFGQDLYTVYSNYSYFVSVRMLGCCQIMPLMYFQLNNVPMFHGAYIIYRVNHTINNGFMETEFVGARMSKRGIPIQPGNVLILDSMDWGLDGENDALEEDNTIWDVSSLEAFIEPEKANVWTNQAVTMAEYDFSELTELAANNDKLYDRLDNINLEEQMGVKTYFAVYEYNKNCVLSSKSSGIASGATDADEEYSKIYPKLNFDSKDFLIPNSKDFQSEMSANEYIRLDIGENIDGNDIQQSVNNLVLKHGDVIVYYATSLIEDRVNKYEKETERNLISGPEFKVLNRGASVFCFGDEDNDKSKYYYSYKQDFTSGKKFIYGSKANHPECFYWTVRIYRRKSFAIGKSAK